MDRTYHDSCGCVYNSHKGSLKSCPGASYVHSNPKTLSAIEAQLLDRHNGSTADLIVVEWAK